MSHFLESVRILGRDRAAIGNSYGKILAVRQRVSHASHQAPPRQVQAHHFGLEAH